MTDSSSSGCSSPLPPTFLPSPQPPSWTAIAKHRKKTDREALLNQLTLLSRRNAELESECIRLKELEKSGGRGPSAREREMEERLKESERRRDQMERRFNELQRREQEEIQRLSKSLVLPLRGTGGGQGDDRGGTNHVQNLSKLEQVHNFDQLPPVLKNLFPLSGNERFFRPYLSWLDSKQENLENEKLRKREERREEPLWEGSDKQRGRGKGREAVGQSDDRGWTADDKEARIKETDGGPGSKRTERRASLEEGRKPKAHVWTTPSLADQDGKQRGAGGGWRGEGGDAETQRSGKGRDVRGENLRSQENIFEGEDDEDEDTLSLLDDPFLKSFLPRSKQFVEINAFADCPGTVNKISDFDFRVSQEVLASWEDSGQLWTSLAVLGGEKEGGDEREKRSYERRRGKDRRSSEINSMPKSSLAEPRIEKKFGTERRRDQGGEWELDEEEEEEEEEKEGLEGVRCFGRNVEVDEKANPQGMVEEEWEGGDQWKEGQGGRDQWGGEDGEPAEDEEEEVEEEGYGGDGYDDYLEEGWEANEGEGKAEPAEIVWGDGEEGGGEIEIGQENWDEEDDPGFLDV